jgi:hypothetical protein
MQLHEEEEAGRPLPFISNGKFFCRAEHSKNTQKSILFLFLILPTHYSGACSMHVVDKKFLQRLGGNIEIH